MKRLRKIKILKKLYKSGYTDEEASDKAVLDSIKEKMQLEEGVNVSKIHQLDVSNLQLKREIASESSN